MSNEAFKEIAYQERITAAMEGERGPNRAQIRAKIRRAPAYFRRQVFGAWRFR